MNQLVFIQDNQVVTDSLTVSEVFNKRHSDVLRSIQNLECSTDFTERNFALSDYTDVTGRVLKKYFITQDGFSFLVMGYTGKKAAEFKEKYITEFNRMKQQLQEQNKPSYMIDDPIKRAEKWIMERKKLERLEEQRKLDEPFTTFGKVVSNSNAAINVGAFAKMMYDKHGIKMGRNKMFQWLRDKGFLIKSGRERNNPKQKYIEQGLFDTSVTVVSRTHGDVESVTTLITGKGQVKIAEMLTKEKGVMVS
ncbi:Rha family transcriptional regulator [Salinibacillus xinjiangensis]|uniref:Phage regulatory protein n=1 Tax=Salinibacillus xinjiangensis TaxID=1229268 RepID=A0A6G1X7Q9_9BACI|nr:phage regulatory protein/antirepressor Ant [Salinibacillus xinjiangensis]MRG86972.1 phage regulatory protein [Salinibacillus xinjiangensis]